jgi:hypothetical protein
MQNPPSSWPWGRAYTLAFVEAREIGKRDVQMLGGGPSSGQVNAVLVQGRCWKCKQEGHSGRAQAHVRKISCKAFNSSVCKKAGDKKTKDEEVTSNSVQFMHSTMGAVNINLCQFKVTGNKIEYNKAISKQLQTRPNVTFSNKEYHQLPNKFVVQKTDPSPTIQVNIKPNIMAYKTPSPPLNIMMAREFVKKLTTTIINPYLSAPMANTWAQVIILGHDYLSTIGTTAVMIARTPRLPGQWVSSTDVSGASRR